MVATRRHPAGDFPDPSASLSSTSNTSPSKPTGTTASTSSISPSRRRKASAAASESKVTNGYSHRPPALVTLWLLVSLPLVIWDTSYILLRPHSLPGGKIHSPVWGLYTIYGNVDYVYGWPAWRAGSGFPAAQATMNVFETAMYGYYLWAVVMSYGSGLRSLVSGRRETVHRAGLTLLVGFAGAVMTLSKTTLYGAISTSRLLSLCSVRPDSVLSYYTLFHSVVFLVLPPSD